MTNTKKLLLAVALLTAISPIVQAMGEPEKKYTLTDIGIETMEESEPDITQVNPEEKKAIESTEQEVEPETESVELQEQSAEFATLDDLQNYFYEEEQPDLLERFEKESNVNKKNELLYQLVCENLSHPIAGNDEITVYQINSLRGQVIYNRKFSNNLETGDIVDYHGHQAIVTDDFEIIPLNTLEWK